MKMEQAITALMIRGFELQQEPFNLPPVDEGDAVEHDPTSSALKAFKKLSDDTQQDVAGKIAIEIVKIVIEEKLPVSTVHHIFIRLAQILGVRKADTKPGGTDDMLKLLEQLEKENDLLDQLDRTYNQAMDEIP